ncbi:MAG: hypothetical protein FWE61_06120 [Micrococcales bacterium]|nr:hypothetical protein [Micrococcales bacterium]
MPRPDEPELPEDVSWAQLHREVRARLRTLSKENAEVVGAHLVMAGRLLDLDPERAYEHTQAAVRRGGRVDVVREAAGLAAYRTGRHAEALRELRTVRRLSGSAEHLAVMADCERALGRPERAVALGSDPDAATLSFEAAVELAIVVSGARLDLGQAEAALTALDHPVVRRATGLVAARVAQARAVALDAAGRPDEATAELASYTDDDLDRAAGNTPVVDDDIVVYDLTEEPEPEPDDHVDPTDGTDPAEDGEPEADTDDVDDDGSNTDTSDRAPEADDDVDRDGSDTDPADGEPEDDDDRDSSDIDPADGAPGTNDNDTDLGGGDGADAEPGPGDEPCPALADDAEPDGGHELGDTPDDDATVAAADDSAAADAQHDHGGDDAVAADSADGGAEHEPGDEPDQGDSAADSPAADVDAADADHVGVGEPDE